MASRLRLLRAAIMLTVVVPLAGSFSAPPASAAPPPTYSVVQSTGTIVPGTTDIGNHCDDCTGPQIVLPFPVTIYGTAYTTANPSSNGNLQFGSSNDEYQNHDLPDSAFADTIFVFWSDLYTGAGGANGQGIFTALTGVSPNRTFVVEWRVVPCCGSGPPDTDFEVIFYEGSTHITVIYGALAVGTLPTGGIQRDGTDFTQWAGSVTPIVAGTRIDLYVGPNTTDDVPAGLRNTPITVTLTATADSPGVVITYYTTDGTTPTTASSVYNPASKPMLTNGQVIKYFSVDNNGRAETVKTSAIALVDADAPVTTDDVANAPTTEPYAVTLTATDAGSGVAATYYTTDGTTPTTASSVYDPASKPTLTNGQTIRYFSVDYAGNAETVRSSSLVPANPTARLVPMAPSRLLDTRVGEPYAAGTVHEIHVAGINGVPADAVAAGLNIVATGSTNDGFLTVFPCGTAVPDASNVNYSVGETVADSVTATIGAGGNVCFYTSAMVHVVVDVHAAYSASGSASLTPMAPRRLLDTRVGGVTVTAGSIQQLQVAGSTGVPLDAIAALVNVTAVGATDAGFVTVFACGNPTPDVSNLNFSAGETIANSAVVMIGADGKICVYTSATIHMVIDVNGAFGPSGTASLAPLTPGRLLDTRAGGVAIPAGSIQELQLAGSNGVPADAVAAVVNVTVIGAGEAGFVTVFACATPTPDASNLNFGPSSVIANSATVAIGAGGKICIYTSATIHLVVDIDGAYIAAA